MHVNPALRRWKLNGQESKTFLCKSEASRSYLVRLNPRAWVLHLGTLSSWADLTLSRSCPPGGKLLAVS